MMLKPSPSRNNMFKGIKVKHILQICVLLAVCLWLIYQVKHSQDKRREFDAKSERGVDKVQKDSEILRFGRKDLPRVTEVDTSDDKHVEDDDDKDDEKDEEEEEEENKPEEDENKHEEDENETDENELEKKEPEFDEEGDVDENHTEEDKSLTGKEVHFEDEEDEDVRNEDHSVLEENKDVDAEDHNEKDDVSDEQDHDVDSADTHGAREEQYKADDASSEVAHHVQSIIPETKNASVGNDMFGKVDNPDASIKTEVKPRENSDVISNRTVVEQNKYHNSTSAILLENQPEIGNSSSSLEGEHPGLQSTITANVSENAIVKGAPGDKDTNLLGNVLGDSDKPKLASDENNQFESSGIPNITENVQINATPASQIGNNTDATETVKDSSVSNESHDEKSENNGAGGSDESSSSRTHGEDVGAIQHDPIDESDNNAMEEEKESRLDLDTLPGIKTEGQSVEEAMAE